MTTIKPSGKTIRVSIHRKDLERALKEMDEHGNSDLYLFVADIFSRDYAAVVPEGCKMILIQSLRRAGQSD